mgnify:CR=1 FL=1|jgi:hypothetical protein|tara:strand:- start:312 stop:833 length:522 start_codon:yes stop_codon:yes gene_type:complete
MSDIKIKQNSFMQNIFETNLKIDHDLFKKINSYPLVKDKELTTSYKTSLTKNLLKELQNYLNKYILAVGKILNKNSYTLQEVWIQKYRIADYHNLHLHRTGKNFYSFILYIDFGMKSGITRFFNIGYPYVVLYEYELKPIKGKCVIFLGALPHESTPSRDNKKIIISGNIQYT